MTKIIVIAGATGVGKSAIAKKLATEFNLSVINSDASQMHYWMDIGTANIDDEASDVFYELYKFFDPDYDFSIKDYQDLARKRVGNYSSVIVCGGSGLYIDALCLDLDLESKKRSADYSSYSNEELYELLTKLNIELANKTHPNNRKRVERYLEIAQDGTDKKREPVEVYDCLFINLELPREVLYSRINARCIKMFDDGWINEAKELLRKGYDLSKITEIGYSDIGLFLDGTLSYEEMIDQIQKKTRHYAKRQLTWFRGAKKKYHNYFVFNPQTDYCSIRQEVEKFLNQNGN